MRRYLGTSVSDPDSFFMDPDPDDFFLSGFGFRILDPDPGKTKECKFFKGLKKKDYKFFSPTSTVYA